MLKGPEPSCTSISLVQVPKIARMCGTLETNTLRLLDPPLIVGLDIDGEYTRQQLIAIGKTFVCKLNLFECNSRQNADYIVEMIPKNSISDIQSEGYELVVKRMHNLVGNTVTTAILLKISNEFDAKRKLFFVFPSLSIRLPATYYLSCTVSRVG